MSKPQTPVPQSQNIAPFFQSMQREMNEFLDRFHLRPVAPTSEFFEAIGTAGFPAIDVAETDDAVEITAEIPGVKEDDIDISIVRDVLTIKGEKSSDHEEKDKDYHVVERHFGSFRRQLPLGFSPDEGAVKASFTDGVLRLKITKPADTKSAVQKIKISRS